MEKNVIRILKKNGNVQEFDGEKIKVAIRKSAERVCVKLTDKEEEKVVNQVKKSLQYNEVPVPVSTIHNMVECALDNVNTSVAKSYREYRDNKSAFASMLDKVYNKKLSLSFIGDRSNANSDSALVTTQKAIVYNELNGELYKKFFLTVEEEKTMSEGFIYVHDRGSRLDSMNCCLFDMKNLLSGGFLMGNLDYQEPKSLDVAFDLIADVAMNAASCQYGGFSISEIDKLLAPYAEKSYQKYLTEYQTICDDLGANYDLDKADKYATNKVRRDMEQGFQGFEMKFNSVSSSRGDYPFTSISLGLGTGKFETMATSVCLKVRKEGQGKPGFKHPVLFPKISFFFDKDLHGKGKELEWLFDEAIDCSSKAMYPDYISCTGDGYGPSMYKKYGVTISRMGCRANLSPWYVRGGMDPADENDVPIYEGRFNLGAISIHFPMIVQQAKMENKDFYEVLDYYLEMIRNIHKRTFKYFAHKKAGTNPLGFCQGGFYNGYLDPEDEIGEDFLRPMTMSFGITALNEASVLQTGKSIAEDNQFAIDVLKHINEYTDHIKRRDGILYAIYGTPAETLCGLQVKQFTKKYGYIEGISDKPYTTNSFHCAVYEDITPIQKQDIEYPMFHLCNGGNIQYCRYRLGYNTEAIKSLVLRAMDLGYYEGVNLQLDYCEKCGHQFIDSDTCPKCGSEEITRIERMNGYLGYSRVNGRTMYNDVKLAEFKDRKSM